MILLELCFIVINMRVNAIMNITGQMPYQKHQPKHKGRNRAEMESPWSRYGSDSDYQAWCRLRPSAYSGKNGQIVYAHYRTAANSGTGCKPPYSGLPLTMQEHQLQHAVGQYHFMEKDRWIYLVEFHLQEWAKSVIKKRGDKHL